MSITDYLNYIDEVLEYGEPEAWSNIRGNEEYPALEGVVLFYPMEKSTIVVATVKGLPKDGFYGFHIHEGVVCSGNRKDPFANAGMHFNPDAKGHPEHAGDLPPLLADKGMAYFVFVTGRFRPKQIIGKTIVIHDMPDDFSSQPAGNSGSKIGCGVIVQACGTRDV